MLFKFLHFIHIILGNISKLSLDKQFRKNVNVRGYTHFEGNIEFGNNTIINSSSMYNLVGLNHHSIFVAKKTASIKIGNNCGFSGNTLYAINNIKVGDNVLFGANAKVFDNDFHPIELDARIIHDVNKIKSKEVVIGDNCWIGANVLILKGVILDENIIVAAGSIVLGGGISKKLYISWNTCKNNL